VSHDIAAGNAGKPSVAVSRTELADAIRKRGSERATSATVAFAHTATTTVVAIHLAERLVETGSAWLAAVVRVLKF